MRFWHLTREQLGTTIPIYNKLFYNSRGQLAEIREGLTPNDTSWQRGSIVNFYSTCWGMCWNPATQTGDSMPSNNGNLKIQQVTIPQMDGADYEQHYDQFTQYFAYDSLNRLQFANEASWKQQYSYDRYGNRTIDQTNTYGTGIPKPDFTVNTGNNRLGVPSGQTGTMSYDNAGNLTTDTYSGTAVSRAYDAENRMTSETTYNSVVSGSYSYDGDGRRVKRKVGGVEAWQVYGVGGELIVEYAANTAAAYPQKEYGYRNGQLLVTATITAGGWGTPPSYTGTNPLSTGDQIKLENLTELRSAVNSLRSHAGLSAFAFTLDPSPDHSTTVKADHIRQLRAALEEARAHLGLSTGGYTHSTLTEGSSAIYAIDFQEIRNQIASAWNNSSSSLDLRWMVTDQLGTPRMIFDQSGSLANVSRHDYLPFGEELAAGTGGRTPQQGYSASDGVRQQFTEKERDNETGLDYFGARYFASTLGRFTSPDPLQASGRSTLPQSWNRYAYVLNNPLRLIDPSGLVDDDPQKKLNPELPPVPEGEVVIVPSSLPPPQYPTTPTSSAVPKVDPFKVGLPPVMPGGGPPVPSSLGIVPGSDQPVGNGVFTAGQTRDYVVLDQNGKALTGSNLPEDFEVTEQVRVIPGSQPQVAEKTSTATLDKKGQFSDTPVISNNQGVFPLPDNINKATLQMITVNDLEKGKSYDVRINCITVSRSGVGTRAHMEIRDVSSNPVTCNLPKRN